MFVLKDAVNAAMIPYARAIQVHVTWYLSLITYTVAMYIYSLLISSLICRSCHLDSRGSTCVCVKSCIK